MSNKKKGVRDPEDYLSPHYSSREEIETYAQIERLFLSNPIPSREILANLGLFITRASMARFLFMHSMYQKIIPAHGVIMEFGVRWGQNLALFSTFRNIYEPQNITRKIIGFDTFEGFPSVSPQDGDSDVAVEGVCPVTPEYQQYLEQLLVAHEKLAPRSHLKKYEVVKGDVIETLPKYLERNPETIIAMAYFDVDLYEPTRQCLELIKDRLHKGSIVGFDELNMHNFPGETIAAMEVLGLRNHRVVRDPTVPYQSYVVIE